MSGIILRSGGGQSDPATSVGFPVGAILHWSGMVAPTGWLLLNGAAWLRSQYPALWAFAQGEIAAGNQFFTIGDGSSTFTARDCRGEFFRGHDGGRGVDPGRGMGSSQEHQIQGHRHQLALPSSTLFALFGVTPLHSAGPGGNGGTYLNSVQSGDPVQGNHGNLNTGTETRPRNIAVNFILYAGV